MRKNVKYPLEFFLEGIYNICVTIFKGLVDG